MNTTKNDHIMTTTIKPYIQLNDLDGMIAYASGYHTHGGKFPTAKRICYYYPFARWYETSCVTRYPLEHETDSLSEVFQHIHDQMQQADRDGLLAGPHYVNDYFIEGLIFLEGGDVIVEFGS